MNTNAHIPEMADRRWHLIAIAMLLFALKSFASAAMVVAKEPYLRVLDWAEAVSALLAAGIVLWLVFLKFTRVPRNERHRFLHLESYVAETIRTSGVTSWNATLVALLGASYASKVWFPEVPARFFLELGIAVMLGAFSVTFFVLNAQSDDEEEVASSA